jgi:hypothetical protein
MEATAAKAASAKATTVEASAASVAAATTAASGRRGWLNQADSRQSEQGYNRFPHHAYLLWGRWRSKDGTPSHRGYSAIKEHSR